MDIERPVERWHEALHGPDRDEKVKLLARLARFMVREEASALLVEDAPPQVAEGLNRLRKLDTLLKRGGVLRGTGEREVESAHDALKGCLTTLILKGERSTKQVVDEALATADHDMPVLAAALNRELERLRVEEVFTPRSW